jgi:hypothetical protein
LSGDDRKLGEILVEMGLCTTENVTAALTRQVERDGMKVGLGKPELIDRKLDEEGDASGRFLTTWQGVFDGAPGRWWREAFAMWAGEGLQGVCSFRITTAGYEFECDEDQIDDIMERLVVASRKAGPTGERNRARDRKHEDTHILFAKVDAIKREMLAKSEAGQEDERRKLRERMARKFKDLEE